MAHLIRVVPSRLKRSFHPVQSFAFLIVLCCGFAVCARAYTYSNSAKSDDRKIAAEPFRFDLKLLSSAERYRIEERENNIREEAQWFPRNGKERFLCRRQDWTISNTSSFS